MGPSYAGILGPIAFVTMLVRGVIDGSSADSVLVSATVSLFAFSVVGYILGRLADHVVLDSVKQRFDRELKAFEKAESSAARGKSAGTAN